MTAWPRSEDCVQSGDGAGLVVLTRSEENSLRMAEGIFTGLGRVDETFQRLERWHLVTIVKAKADARFWFATATARGRAALVAIEGRR
jgi:hypothetical protein